jgi:hypothetical protein
MVERGNKKAQKVVFIFLEHILQKMRSIEIVATSVRLFPIFQDYVSPRITDGIFDPMAGSAGIGS